MWALHLRDFFLYYMQAIWSIEPPGQRYLRLCTTQDPVIELDSREYRPLVAKRAGLKPLRVVEAIPSAEETP